MDSSSKYEKEAMSSESLSNDSPLTSSSPTLPNAPIPDSEKLKTSDNLPSKPEVFSSSVASSLSIPPALTRVKSSSPLDSVVKKVPTALLPTATSPSATASSDVIGKEKPLNSGYFPRNESTDLLPTATQLAFMKQFDEKVELLGAKLASAAEKKSKIKPDIRVVAENLKKLEECAVGLSNEAVAMRRTEYKEDRAVLVAENKLDRIPMLLAEANADCLAIVTDNFTRLASVSDQLEGFINGLQEPINRDIDEVLAGVHEAKKSLAMFVMGLGAAAGEGAAGDNGNAEKDDGSMVDDAGKTSVLGADGSND